MPDVTVVLPTRNEVRNITPFLDSLPPDVPLVVVDSSDDATPEVILDRRPHNTTVLRRPATIAEARQIGAEAARTPWLLFTDADVTFAPAYFARLPRHLAGHGLIYGPKLSAGDYRTYYRLFSWGMHAGQLLGIPGASGSNLLISREAFVACGGFDRTLPVNEDTEIAFRIKRCGFRTRFATDLEVYATDHRRLRQGVLRKTLHSLARGLLLYYDLLPRDWRRRDWGYWKKNGACL